MPTPELSGRSGKSLVDLSRPISASMVMRCIKWSCLTVLWSPSKRLKMPTLMWTTESSITSTAGKIDLTIWMVGLQPLLRRHLSFTIVKMPWELKVLRITQTFQPPNHQPCILIRPFSTTNRISLMLKLWRILKRRSSRNTTFQSYILCKWTRKSITTGFQTITIIWRHLWLVSQRMSMRLPSYF